MARRDTQPAPQVTDLIPRPLDRDEVMETLARRYRRAGNLGVQLLNSLNGPTDALLDRLPPAARVRLEGLTIRGLEAAMTAASGTRGLVKDQKGWVNTATTAAAGLAGGVGGLPTALAELPVTVTLLMRSIQAVAVDYGFDPDDDQTRKDALLVFAAQGPLAGAATNLDLNFLASRATLNGANVLIGIGLVAPKLAAVLGRKLAVQTVPVLGAVTAVATNFAYCDYYQQMAHVVFGLRRLSEETGTPFVVLVDDLRHRTDLPVNHARVS
ncbi:EcsC family protein [Mesobacterium sp. TK19101]|uniref:EcsC family protein n=1 Tax=Mesobacterium hydrothermale TaxID=3111907 RepID=A0ABU6HHV2_9RHOB|nr:EcsC family protein [Mesobacterium sp. TK19101]MEC3862039.1 EcsC family protein [Mesobacterium sp. TK19101]